MSEEVVNVDIADLMGGEVVENETTESPAETPNTTTEETAVEVDKNFIVDPRMYVYVDTEFTGLKKDAELLSIGLCDAEGHSFYAEFIDFNYSSCSEFVFKNVLCKMVNPPTVLKGDHWTLKNDSKTIRMNLITWLQMVHDHTGCGIQFVTDCGHYDMVNLIDLLWKDAILMPRWICPTSVDINTDIANIVTDYNRKASNPEGEPYVFNPYYEAFNMNREEFSSNIENAPTDMRKHNSLYDAYIIRAIHQSIWDIHMDISPLEAKAVAVHD